MIRLLYFDLSLFSLDANKVYFYVHKTVDKAMGNPLPFEIAKTNVGNAMDIKTGVFTAPVDGNYFFTFSCVSNKGGTLRVQLMHNGAAVGTAVAKEPLNTAAMQSLLTLVKGDKISLSTKDSDEDSEGIREKSNRRQTHFTGMLLF